MQFLTFRKDGLRGLAVRDANGAFHGRVETDPGYPGPLDTLLTRNSADLATIGQILLTGMLVDLAGVAVLPPLESPGKIICVGLNYVDHATESGMKVPEFPALFARFPSSLIGHGEPLLRPAESVKLDYEGELVAVIGKAGRRIAKADALDHVAGYSIFNDGSVRDFQLQTSQWTMGKNFDGTGAFGPVYVTADELPPGARGLRLQTRLNGEVMQSASTDDLMFDVASLVSLISIGITLLPGDIIVTGTPSGVGAARKPPVFMKAGDICEIEIDRIGVLRNRIVDDTAAVRAEAA